MICLFADRETERIAAGLRSRKLPPDIQDRAFRMLLQISRVQDWNELRNPPGNRLHALSGDREGQYAIRINRQWRIAFFPKDGMLTDVRITDYH